MNEGATHPLILPVHVVCNTSDEVLYGNVKANSLAHPTNWLQQQDAHDGIAILCGSGPSLADNISNIVEWRNEGAAIFSMNGSAAFLDSRGVTPDYQVIVDAKPETASLVGPARQHLFASQVDPECFRRAPDARLWHLAIERIEEYFDTEDAYVMIGGGTSVGVTALCLAYALGYRKIHCYGYDSSHRDGHGHAFEQPMNAGDPCAWVEFAGKQYLCSLTMRCQAEKFVQTAIELRQLGCTVVVRGEGLLPDIFNMPPVVTELDKYERMWMYQEYRHVAPGEILAGEFIKALPTRGTVIDFGCGTGRGAKRLQDAGYQVTALDFAGNCLDKDVNGTIRFIKHDLVTPFAEKADYAYCTDVLEHIPPGQVDDVLRNIFTCCRTAFLHIALTDDSCGVYIGKALHLSVHDAEWWIAILGSYGHVEVISRSSADLTVIVRR